MGGSITVKIPKVENNNAFKRVISQPSSREIIRRTGKKPLIVYWYFTKPVKRDGIIQKDECIPLIVENKKIIGIGLDPPIPPKFLTGAIILNLCYRVLRPHIV